MMITNRISGSRLVILFISIIHCTTGQMKWSSWSRYSECSVTCGQGRQRRQRSCIKTSPTSTGTCVGPKEMYAPCQMLTCPKNEVLPCNCGCTLQAKSGKIVSQLPSRETKSCEWRILVKKGNKISLNITKLLLKAGWIRVASGKKALLTLLKPGPEPQYPWRYVSDGNVMTLELLSYPDASGQSHSDTYLAAEYKELNGKASVKRLDTRNRLNNSNNIKSPNVTAIIGITACVVVIVLVAVFLAVRRHRKRNESEAEDERNDNVSLHEDYDGKPRSNASTHSKEEKPLMDATTECDRLSPPQAAMLMKPNAIQGRDSSYDSEKCLRQPNPNNVMVMPRYPPEYYMKTPTYVHDPNFVRMMPVTTTGHVQNAMQPIVMHSPRTDS